MEQDYSRDPVYQMLAPFFANNPEAEFGVDGGEPFIAKPWGDPTLRISLRPAPPEVLQEICAVLNAVRLPPNFTAIWHLDSRDLEFIWTIEHGDKALVSRSLEFEKEGRSYRCEYGDGSSRLIWISLLSEPAGPASSTQYRNLIPISLALRFEELRELSGDDEEPSPRKARAPISFWIRNYDGDEASLIDFAWHLNFYMNYFDRTSPKILVHDQPSTKPYRFVPVRYPWGAFPGRISARILDGNLLSLWASSSNGDMFSRLISNYQVLEYCAFYYLQADTRARIGKVLSSPQSPIQLFESTQRIVEIMAEEKLHDTQKFNMVFERVVDPKSIWDIVAANIEFFSSEIRFDGGFKIDRLVNKDWGYDDFLKVWSKVPGQLREIRHALVHSRETKVGGVISPTPKNFDQLQPWLAILSEAALQMIACEGQF